jgi:DNA-directed RNA polymerase specialized sigma24 family protein
MAGNFFFEDKDASDLLNRDKLLKQLVQEIQEQGSFLSKQQLILARIAEIILRSRPICHLFKGKPLTGIYREIYDLVKIQLQQDLKQELEKYNIANLINSNWSNKLQNQAFKKVLDDRLLKALGLAAQEHLPQTELRSYALTELIKAIQLSGRLCRPHREKFSPQFYELIYEEAVNETFTYICLNIDKYDPERGDKKFMNWVNFRLDKLVIDCRRKFSHWQNKQIPSLMDIEEISQPQEQFFLSEIIYQYIEEDPDDIFKTIHIKNRDEANFQKIALARFSGQSWEEIAQELNIVVPTLSSFFQRSCSTLAPLLKEKLQS